MTRAAYGLSGGGPHHGRWIALTAASAVLVIAAAAVTLTAMNSRLGSGSPPSGAVASGHGRVSSTSGLSSTSGRAGAAAVHPAGALAGGRRIVIAPGAAGSPHAQAVVWFLTRYFAAINAHDYRAYRRLFSPATRGALSQAAFIAGYGTTRDSAASLRAIRVTGPGQLAAMVSFTSHQQPGQSLSQSSCTVWHISLYLTRTASGYLLQAPPAGYQASFRACA